jgi:hypothetical protein
MANLFESGKDLIDRKEACFTRLTSSVAEPVYFCAVPAPGFQIILVPPPAPAPTISPIYGILEKKSTIFMVS